MTDARIWRSHQHVDDELGSGRGRTGGGGGRRLQDGFHRDRPAERADGRCARTPARCWNKHGLRAVCSLGLPQATWASVNPEGAIEHLKVAIDKTAEMGAQALSGVTYGGIGERTGVPPTQAEYDNIARALTRGGQTREDRAASCSGSSR